MSASEKICSALNEKKKMHDFILKNGAMCMQTVMTLNKVMSGLKSKKRQKR